MDYEEGIGYWINVILAGLVIVGVVVIMGITGYLRKYSDRLRKLERGRDGNGT